MHPNESRIEGLTVYKTIADVPRPIDRAALYLPPQVTLGIIAGIAAAEPAEAYFSPGADAPELIAKAREFGMKVVQACSIVDIGLSPAQFP